MRGTRVIITALNLKWAYHAANAMTGFATSVIGCGVEAGIERELSSNETPDGRPGISILMFAMGSKVLMQQLETRMGQCILTCPTAAAFAGIECELNAYETPDGRAGVSVLMFAMGSKVLMQQLETRMGMHTHLPYCGGVCWH